MVTCTCGGEINKVTKNTLPFPTARCIQCGKDWGVWTDMPEHTYMSTYSGFRINIPEFNLRGIPYRDIAHQLSLIPRYSGSVRQMYSSGQHALIVSHLIDQRFALRGLVHDATDMIFGDLAAPLKHHPLMKGFYDLEKQVQDKFYHEVGLCSASAMLPEEHAELKKWDKAVQDAEARDLTCLTFWQEFDRHKLVPWTIEPMEPSYVEHLFLQRLRLLTKGKT